MKLFSLNYYNSKIYKILAGWILKELSNGLLMWEKMQVPIKKPLTETIQCYQTAHPKRHFQFHQTPNLFVSY